ncbi:MAG: hypothetical protein ACXAB7_15330 [Candidatus Kariarchaeaceae archaeon]
MKYLTHYTKSGYTRKRNLWLLILLLLPLSFSDNFGMKALELNAGNIELEWSYAFGGDGIEIPGALVQTSDGGFAVAGQTSTWGAGGQLDFWLLKTDASGQAEWNRTYGDPGQEYATSLVQTSDGGFALLGVSNLWHETEASYLLLVKTDGDGNQEWNNTFSSSLGDEEPIEVIETSDGFAILVNIESSGNEKSDLWLVKTDKNGQHVWNNTFGGSAIDRGEAMIQTSDGGFVLSGYTESYGSGGVGKSDYWLVKTDPNGNQEWDNTFGDALLVDGAVLVVETSDNGFVLVGNFESYYGEEEGGGGWFVKTDANGEHQWNKTLEGAFMHSAVRTSDGGFVLADETNGDISLVKTDGVGNKEWERFTPEEKPDVSYFPQIIQAMDGGLIIAGGEADSPGAMDWDIRLIKTVPISSIKDSSDDGFLNANALLIFCSVLVLGILHRRIKRRH